MERGKKEGGKGRQEKRNRIGGSKRKEKNHIKRAKKPNMQSKKRISQSDDDRGSSIYSAVDPSCVFRRSQHPSPTQAAHLLANICFFLLPLLSSEMFAASSRKKKVETLYSAVGAARSLAPLLFLLLSPFLFPPFPVFLLPAE